MPYLRALDDERLMLFGYSCWLQCEGCCLEAAWPTCSPVCPSCLVHCAAGACARRHTYAGLRHLVRMTHGCKLRAGHAHADAVLPDQRIAALTLQQNRSMWPLATTLAFDVTSDRVRRPSSAEWLTLDAESLHVIQPPGR